MNPLNLFVWGIGALACCAFKHPKVGLLLFVGGCLFEAVLK